mgnify:CR=1 FL=1
MDEGREKARKILALLSNITDRLRRNENAYSDIEFLEGWTQSDGIYITFHADGWQWGEICPDLLTSDLADIAKKSIEVICKRINQRNIEALRDAKEIQEILTEAEDDKERSE